MHLKFLILYYREDNIPFIAIYFSIISLSQSHLQKYKFTPFYFSLSREKDTAVMQSVLNLLTALSLHYL